MTTTPNRTGTPSTGTSTSTRTRATSSNIHHHRRNREDTELPGIAAIATAIGAGRPLATTTSSTAAVSVPFTTTPLLLLLDGVLSLDETRIRDAMQEIVYGLHVGIAVGVSGSSGGGVASILPPVVSEQQNHPHPRRHHHHHHSHSSSPNQSHNLNNHSSHPFQRNIQESSPGTCTSATSLCNILEALLNQYPTLAQIPSDHDGSLPLHFAASLGIVPVAMSIWQRVRLFAFVRFVCFHFIF
jgi:hypothetical protein